jgi:transcriptional antiterminator RfaH
MTVPKEAVWYAVHTRPREELKALAHLRRQNYDVYLPRYAKRIRHARRVERVLRPFFPRYLFVSLNLAIEGWRPIRSTLGVSDIVSFGDQPTPLPAGVIEELKHYEDAEGCIGFKRQNSIKRGDKVTVLSGPFSRLLGLCESVADNERVSILLDLLGRKVRVSIEAEAVAAA